MFSRPRSNFFSFPVNGSRSMGAEANRVSEF